MEKNNTLPEINNTAAENNTPFISSIIVKFTGVSIIDRTSHSRIIILLIYISHIDIMNSIKESPIKILGL